MPTLPGTKRRAPIGRLALAVAAVSAAALVAACSLGNIHHDACKSDTQCATAFGAGSKCSDGYCTTPANVGCQQKGPDGRACFAISATCPPESQSDFQNACTAAQCAPFDNKSRLTKLGADGSLPPLP